MSTAMWKLEKDLCRCCHAEGSFKHLSDPCFTLGQEEIYSDMLQDCLDLRIVPMTGVLSDVTYTICDSCVARLRDASNFKKQVQDCEERFKDMYSRNMIKGFGVKEEPGFNESDDMKQEFQSVDDDDDDAFMNFDDDADDSLEDQPLITLEDTKAKGKAKAKPKPKPKKPTPVKKAKTKEKPVKMESEDLTVAAVSGEKKKGKTMELKADFEETEQTVDYDELPGADFEESLLKEDCEESVLEEDYEESVLEADYDETVHEADYEETDRKAVCEVTTDKTGNEIFNCLDCGRQYITKGRFTQHYRHIHLKLRHKRFPCPVCRIPLLPHKKAYHLEAEHGRPAPTCKVCGRKFSAPHLVLRHHRLVHMGEKNYTCDECGKAFWDRAHLKSHQLRHSDVKNYACEICGKRFRRKRNLTTHLDMHMDIRRYVCTVCGQSFVQSTSLKYHFSRHHPEEVS